MKKRKVKRYDAGGTTEAVEMPEITEETESERRSKGLLSEQGKIIGGAMAPRRKIEDYIRKSEKTSDESGSKEQTFGQAFAEARRGGAKTFTYDGKRYTTEMASQKGSRSSKYDDVVKGSDLGSQDFSSKSSAKKEDKTSSSAVPVALAGAGAAAALARMAMSKRGEGKKDSLAERVKAREGRSQSGSTVGKMPGSSLNDPYSMTLGGDLDPRSTLRGNKRMGMDSGGTEFKRGGKIQKMSSGGKASSASKRADGIAQKGKTRGRIC